MMHRFSFLFACLCSSLSLALQAQTIPSTAASTAAPPAPMATNWQSAQMPYLPPQASAKAAILESPAIQLAKSKKDSLNSKAQAIRLGSHELSLRTSLQQRRIPLSSERYTEPSVSLERPIRAWGKASVDADLSKQTETLAGIEYADAIHEASRDLIKLWFTHLRAWTEQALTKSSLNLAQSLYRQATVRLTQGDISQVDATLAHAELQRAQAAHEVSQAQYASSQAMWLRRYPAIELPKQSPIAALPELKDSLEAMRTLYLAHSHELNWVRADARRLQLVAIRTEKDQRPDPTLSLYATSERGGAERLIGASILIPLAGQARMASASSALADAQAADSKVQQMEQQFSADMESLYRQFTFKRQAALYLRSAAQEQQFVIEKSRKAYALGEYSMSDILTITRNANEHQRSAELMTLEVVELFTRLGLDLHQLWDFDE